MKKIDKNQPDPERSRKRLKIKIPIEKTKISMRSSKHGGPFNLVRHFKSQSDDGITNRLKNAPKPESSKYTSVTIASDSKLTPRSSGFTSTCLPISAGNYMPNITNRNFGRREKEPPDDGAGRVCMSIVHAMAILMIGAVNIVCLAYALKTGDMHAFLCTIGWHLFCVLAILALSVTNGWAFPLSLQNRRIFHMTLQIMGLICMLVGAVLVVSLIPFKHFQTHGKIGLAAMVMSFLTAIAGPVALLNGAYYTFLHVALAIPTFITASICLGTGLYQKKIQEFIGTNLVYILIGFVVFITTFAILTALYKSYIRLSTFTR